MTRLRPRPDKALHRIIERVDVAYRNSPEAHRDVIEVT
jgi:hypothetical protein